MHCFIVENFLLLLLPVQAMDAGNLKHTDSKNLYDHCNVLKFI